MGRVAHVAIVVSLGAISLALQAQSTVEVHQKFRTEESGIDLVGVCRVNEAAVNCWGPDRRNAPDLESKFKAHLISQRSASVPIKYGQKTRIAVFRIDNPHWRDYGTTIETGFDRSNTRYELWHDHSAEEFSQHLIGTVITAALEDQVGKAVTSISRRERPSASLLVQEGSQIEYLGKTITLRKIINSPEESLPEYMKQQRWTLAMTIEGDKTPQDLTWVATGHDGLTIRAVSRDGDPVHASPNVHTPSAPRQTAKEDGSAPDVLPALLQHVSSYAHAGNDYMLSMNINPSKIKSIVALGRSQRKLVITGIPLEPKR
jgi:hypothetical protein